MLKKLKALYRAFTALNVYWFDLKNDLKYTIIMRGKWSDKESLLCAAGVAVHTIEKGLTMPNKRFNFGHAKIKEIAKDVFYCADHFDDSGSRFADIVGILKEYEVWHKTNNVAITDAEVSAILHALNERWPNIAPTQQIYGMSFDNYFSKRSSNFAEFAASRHSCRNLSGKIDVRQLNEALDLAVKTAPSTCNRQSVRVHILNSKKVTEIQDGNRGFGHLADNFLLVTAKLGYWRSVEHRNGEYVDGGIFLMNLLYALHFYGIGACTLNMYLDPKDTRRMHKELDVPKDETPIALVAIGIPPQSFDLALSKRCSTEEIVCTHG